MYNLNYLLEASKVVNKGDNKISITYLTKELELHPNNAQLHFLLASVYASDDNLQQAVSNFELALKAQPDFLICRFQFAFYLMNIELFDESLSQFGLILSYQKNDYLEIFAKGFIQLLMHENIEQCITLLKAGILENKDNLALNSDMEQAIMLLQSKNNDGNDSNELSLSTSAMLNVYNNLND